MQRNTVRRFPAALAGSAGAVLVALFGHAPPLKAQTAGSMLEWHCVQERDAGWHVGCVARTDHPVVTPAPLGVTAVANAPVPTFMGRDMRPVAARGAAEVLSARSWRIPLHAQPTDRAAVAGLLGAVLCGDIKTCSVNYEGIAGSGAVAENGFGR